MSFLGFLCAFAAAVFWGLSPVFQKQALRELNLTELNAVRGVGVLIALIPALLYFGTQDLRMNAEAYLMLFAMTLLINIVGDVFMFIAVRTIGVSRTSPITSSYPLWVAFLSWFFLKETLTFSVLMGTLAIVIGLILLNFQRSSERFQARGMLAAVLASLCWAFGLVMHKNVMMRGFSVYGVMFWRCAFLAILAFGIWGFELLRRPEQRTRIRTISRRAWFSGVNAGLSGLLLGGWMFSIALKAIPVSVATPISSTSPLIAALVATLTMGERLRPVQWGGIVFVVLGAITITT